MSYTKPALSGYNSSPPPDDGSLVSANEIKWVTHKTKLTDPLKTYIDGVNNNVDTAFSDLASTANGQGSALLGWLSNLTGAIKRTLYDWLLDRPTSVLDFMTASQRTDYRNSTGSVDLTLAIQAALDTGKDILIPNGRGLTGALTLTTEGQTLTFASKRAILELDNATENLFTASADHITIKGGRLDGAATNDTTTSFAIFTAVGSPAKYLKILNMTFSGKTSSVGFNNGVKYDTSSDYGSVSGCVISRLWGNISGTGYGVLGGEADGLKVNGNWMFASSGRGRHAIYFSAGCSFCTADDNFVSAFDYEGITQFSQGVQPPCVRNKITNNIVIDCAASNNATSGAIGVYGHSDMADIDGNIVTGSGAVGIVVSGAGFTDHKDTKVRNNQVDASQLVGIDFISAVGFELTSNTVRESSQAAVGTHSNIRLTSDGTTKTSDGLITGNKSTGTSFARSPFQIDSTVPTPTGLKLIGNYFPTAQLTGIELNSVTCEIDGRIRYSTTYNPASIANGAAVTTSYTIPGADQGDVVGASHTADSDGCSITGYSDATNSVRISILNNSGATKDIATGTLYIDVWKRIR